MGPFENLVPNCHSNCHELFGILKLCGYPYAAAVVVIIRNR